MKKKIFKILLAVAIAVSLLVAVNMVANAEMSDFIYTVSNNEATITGYIGADTDIEIPSTLYGYPVIAIGEEAFAWNESITSVTIPDSVTSIDYRAFYRCTSLTNVTIGNSVTNIGHSAFRGCSSLTSVVIPDGVKVIGASSFESCTSLTGITIPDSVTDIGAYAFDRCTSLQDVYYIGTPSQWNSINIYDYNAYLTNATLHTSRKVFGIVTNWSTEAGDAYTDDKRTYRIAITMLVDGELKTYRTEDFISVMVPATVFDETTLKGLTPYRFAELQLMYNGKVEVVNREINIDYVTYDDLSFTLATAVDGDLMSTKRVTDWLNPVPKGWSVDEQGRPVYNDRAAMGEIVVGGSEVVSICDETKFITVSNKLEDFYYDDDDDIFQEIGASEITAGGTIKVSDFDNDIYYIFAYTTFGIGEAKNEDNDGSMKNVIIFPRFELNPNAVPADYTAVEKAISKIPADLTICTDETAQAVTDSVNAVDYSLNSNHQSIVDAYAAAIEDAVAKLQFKPADYTAVEEALAKVSADLTIYTEETAKVVTDAVKAVVYGLTAKEQATVDAYAQAIEDAVANLEILGTIKLTDDLVNYRLRCTTAVVDGNLVLTATTAGTSSLKVRFGNLPEGATLEFVETNANASMANGIITVTNPGMKNVEVPMVITSAEGVKTEFVLVADFNNAIRYATYARLSQTGNNITVTSGAATAYVLFDTTYIEGGYVEVTDVSRNLLGRYVVSGSAVRFYNPVYDDGKVTVNVKNANGETVETYSVTAIFADATEYTAVLDTSLRCTYEVDGDNITVTADAGVSNVYLNFGRYYSESLSASVNNEVVKKMGARSWRVMAADEPIEFDLYFDATAYGAEKVTRHVIVNF